MPQKRRLLWYISILLIVLLFCLGIRLMPPSKPGNLGLTDGKLGGCPSSPNCVSSEANDAAHRVASIEFTGSIADAKEQLVHIVGQLPRISELGHPPSFPSVNPRLPGFEGGIRRIPKQNNKTISKIEIYHRSLRFCGIAN